MRSNKDTRGRSYFDVFPDQEGQTDISINYPGTIRAFHQHLYKNETWICMSGHFKVVLATETNETPIKFVNFLSEGESVFIPSGTWHGFQVLGNEKGEMVEYTTEKHDPSNLDDFRKPFDEFDKWQIEKK